MQASEDLALKADDSDDYRSELSFIKQFELDRGRPLRVLHIGNIANNAYNNALIQRQFGIEADTICFNYYHVMGCPEWEAASFDGRIDSMFPDWWATELGGWQRPDWFVQGPIGECLSYLRAKNAGDKGAAAFFWTLLQARYWEILDGVAAAQGRVRQPMPESLAQAISVVRDYFDFKSWKLLQSSQLSVVPEVVSRVGQSENPSELLPREAEKLSRVSEQRPQQAEKLSLLVSIYRSFLTKGIFVHLRREAETGIGTEFRFALALWQFQRRVRDLPRFGFEFPHDFFRFPDDGAANVNPAMSVMDFEKLHEPSAAVSNEIHFQPNPDPDIPRSTDLGLSINPAPNSDPIEKPEFRYLEQYGKGEDNRALRRETRLARVLHEFRQFSPEILRTVDAFASTVANEFADVLEYYDVIQGYSIDGFIPFINGFKNYTCYEHGTLREIPFEKSYNGILCSLAYKNAAFSFVTNSDALPSAKRLKLKKARTVCLPHAFDDRKVLDFLATCEIREQVSGITTFFSPSRHHWHTEPASMQKGNDLFLNAAAQVARTNRNFRIILVEWGVDVQRSKDLIRSLGIEDIVAWIPTLNKAELRRAYCSCDVVVDQFRIPAMGGVTFEAMALGRRVITRLDQVQTAEFFGVAPPCLAADSVESCTAWMFEVLADPSDEAGHGDAARSWFKKYHSARRIVALQLAAYRKMLDSDAEPVSFSILRKVVHRKKSVELRGV